MEEIGAQIQEREDADMVMRAESQIKGAYLEWEGEAKQRKGQQAWGVAKEAGQWWDDNARKTRETLTNGRQKRLFDQTIAPLATQSIGTFSHHEQSERRASLVESAQASVVGSINLAAANAANPQVLQSSKADILKRSTMLAQLNGWSPEVRDAKLSEYLTSLHKQVIQALVRDDPAAALGYFEANKEEIEGSQRAEVGGFAARATAARVGDQAAAEVWQSMGPKSDRDPVTLDTREEAVRKRLGANDEAVKAAIAGLRDRALAFKDSRRERDDQLEAQVNAAILNGASLRQLHAMPAFHALSPESARKIATFVENQEYTRLQRGNAALQREELTAQREQRRLERDGMARYLDLSNPDRLVAMSEAQIINLLPELGNEHTKHLIQKRRELVATPSKLSEAKVDDVDFKQVAQEMGLDPFRRGSDDRRATLGALKFRVEQLIAATQKEGKRSLARDEKLALMRNEIARAVTLDSGLFSKRRVPVILLNPEDVDSVIVPPEDRRDIVQSMNNMARQYPNDPRFKPTEDNLRRWYLRGKSPAAAFIAPRREASKPPPPKDQDNDYAFSWVDDIARWLVPESEPADESSD